jgi:hypothetical protein
LAAGYRALHQHYGHDNLNCGATMPGLGALLWFRSRAPRDGEVMTGAGALTEPVRFPTTRCAASRGLARPDLGRRRRCLRLVRRFGGINPRCTSPVWHGSRATESAAMRRQPSAPVAVAGASIPSLCMWHRAGLEAPEARNAPSSRLLTARAGSRCRGSMVRSSPLRQQPDVGRFRDGRPAELQAASPRWRAPKV